MPLYRPSELIAFLRSLGVEPKRALSQNFLIDGNIVKKIIALAHPTQGVQVVEIGPGPGVLTEQLLEAGFSVLAIEKDRVFARELSRLDPLKRKLQVIEADVLDLDFEEVVLEGAVIVANIPYHITREIVEKILFSKKLRAATLLVQEEVAERLTAQAGSAAFDELSLLTEYFSLTKYGFHVPKKCFYPAPKVGSAVVHLVLTKRYHTPYEDRFLQAVDVAFKMRRKMLRSTLGSLYPARVVDLVLGDDTRRPDEVSCKEWIEIIHRLEKMSGGGER